MANFEEKNFFLEFVPFDWFDQRIVVLPNSYFNQDLTLFKHVKKNQLSNSFIALFWDSRFFDEKEKFSVNLPENASQQQKSIV